MLLYLYCLMLNELILLMLLHYGYRVKSIKSMLHQVVFGLFSVLTVVFGTNVSCWCRLWLDDWRLEGQRPPSFTAKEKDVRERLVEF